MACLAARRMPHKHHPFLAQAPQVLHQSRNILDVLFESVAAVAFKGAPQARLKHGEGKPGMGADMLGHMADEAHGMRPVAQAADEDERITGRRGRKQLIGA